ncbi:MAG: YjbH domain-containing protein [Epsilonproteobacteria bacterium]|nr:YjbH domain-containing protein [Campylobacterota bacterium]
MRSLVLISILSINSFSNEFSNRLSFQSFTGVINTPNAQVLKEGEAVLQYNNQFDNNLRLYDYGNSHTSKDDYMAGIGLFPSLEMVGRLVEAEEYLLRDLSASFKYKIPYDDTYLPSLAIGLQDVGSSSSFYDNTYVVMDKELWGVRASLGYGKSGDNKLAKRMDGLFGSLEAQATDWLSIMVEHDGEENHAAVRLSIPQSWTSSFKVDALVAQNLTESATSFAVNLSIPLFDKSQKLKYMPDHETRKVSTVQKNEPSLAGSETKLAEKLSNEKPIPIMELQKKLVEFGFENISVGEYEDTLYVACENTIFDHNELDALGYILGLITTENFTHKKYAVTLLKNNLQTMTVLGHRDVFKQYLEEPTSINYLKLERNLKFSRDFDTSNVKFVSQKANSSFFKPRVELSAGLITTIGTEVGVFDYLASLRTNLYTTLYDGLMVSAMYETPLTHSENFDKGKVYYNTYNENMDSRLVNAMVHQTLHYDKLLNTTSIGKFRTNYNGVLNQTNFVSESGSHGMNLKLGAFEYDNDKRELYLGSYRYFYEPFDLFTEVTYGQYWNQDKGASLALKRFFGETALSLYYKNTTADDYVGFELSLPFTLRKIPNTSIGQVKGKTDFNYGFRTTVRRADGSNKLNPAGGVAPKSDFEVTSYYLNRDRLNPLYIKGNLKRLRESYLLYRE